MLTEEERKELIGKLNITFCMPELWKNRESFLNLTDEQMMAIFSYTQQGVKALEQFR